jgi:hypothetical protein
MVSGPAFLGGTEDREFDDFQIFQHYYDALTTAHCASRLYYCSRLNLFGWNYASRAAPSTNGIVARYFGGQYNSLAKAVMAVRPSNTGQFANGHVPFIPELHFDRQTCPFSRRQPVRRLASLPRDGLCHQLHVSHPVLILVIATPLASL